MKGEIRMHATMKGGGSYDLVQTGLTGLNGCQCCVWVLGLTDLRMFQTAGLSAALYFDQDCTLQTAERADGDMSGGSGCKKFNRVHEPRSSQGRAPPQPHRTSAVLPMKS